MCIRITGYADDGHDAQRSRRNDGGAGMSKGPSFVRMYPSDWRSGCLGLTLEQEGLYVRMCMFIAETGRRVPIDDTEAARVLGVQTRNYRRVLGELLRIGKIKRHDGGYGNDRIEFERERAQAGLKKAAGDSEHPAEAAVGPDRETDQGQGRENHAAAVGNVDTATVERRYNADITAVAAEKTQCFLRATKEPEPELEKNSGCVSRAGANPNSVSANSNSAMPPGFEPLGHGALINCETIRHPNFTISITAVKMDLALQCPTLDARQVCSSAALQWAAEIEGGKSPREAVPANIRGAIVAGARMGHFRTLEHEVRTAKQSTSGPRAPVGRMDFGLAKAERAKELIRKLGVASHDA